jgi:hypothetical protein
VRLKEHGAAEFGLDGEHGRVEALKVTGLQDAAAFGGAGDEVVGLGEGGDQGFSTSRSRPASSRAAATA